MPPKTRSGAAGFTLLELMIVVAIIAAILLLTFAMMANYRTEDELNFAASEMAATLREAQSRAMAQSSSTSWGVHFGNSTTTAPFFSLFMGSSYSASLEVGHYRLPVSVEYLSSTVPVGGSVDVIFPQITGLPSSSSTVSIKSTGAGNVSSTITVNANGSVSF